jgi:argininosuccinate lyase
MPEARRTARARVRAKLWSGRLPEGTSALVERYTSSVDDDRRLILDDVDGSLAHARMLRTSGLLKAAELRALERGLRRIRSDAAAGGFRFAPADEDVHSAVERRLFELEGAVAGRLHTGRSRNDQVATDLVLYTRRACASLMLSIAALQEVLVERASEQRDTVLPGYTHGQRAQVISLAHHLLAYVEMLQRDAGRLVDTASRCELLPLGSGALAGSMLPLDRAAAAAELGFAGPSANSVDSVSDRDFAVEAVAACALLMTHLSRLAEDFVTWSSAEFGFVELADAHATGSSLMPHKKNPDVLELARARSGRVTGDLVTLLTVLKGIPLAYDRDLQEVKRPLFDALDTAASTLEVLAELLAAVRFDARRMRDAASDPQLFATDLVEHLVQGGVAFRTAHELVAAAVRTAHASGTDLRSLTEPEWSSISPLLGGGEVRRLLDVRGALARRVTAGGPGPRSVSRQLARARRLIERNRRAAGARTPREGVSMLGA